MVATFALPDGVDVTYLNEPRFVAEEYSRSFKLKDLVIRIIEALKGDHYRFS